MPGKVRGGRTSVTLARLCTTSQLDRERKWTVGLIVLYSRNRWSGESVVSVMVHLESVENT